MKKVVIIGVGGMGRETLEIFKADNNTYSKWEICGFIDDNYSAGTIINGYPILGNLLWYGNYCKEIGCVIAIGNPLIKKQIFEKLKVMGATFYNIIHPSVIVSDYIKWGEGVIVCAGCILTVNIVIGNHVIINYNTTVGHDTVIEEFCSIMPSSTISGNDHLSEGCYIGAGSTIIHQVTIGAWSIIGAGAVVTKNIANNVLAVGIPANIKKAL